MNQQELESFAREAAKSIKTEKDLISRRAHGMPNLKPQQLQRIIYRVKKWIIGALVLQPAAQISIFKGYARAEYIMKQLGR